MFVNLSLISLFFWSMPFLPGTYASIAPYISGIYGAIYILSGAKFDKRLMILAYLILCVITIYSTLSLFIYGFDLVKFISYYLSFFSFFGFIYIFNSLGRYKVYSVLHKMAVFTSIVAIVEQVCILIKVLSPLKSFLNMLFTGGISSNILVFTSEPSWAVQLLLFSSIFLYWKYIESKSKTDLFLITTNFLVFIITFSLTGILVLIFCIFFYFLFFGRINYKLLFKYSIVFIVLIFGVYYSFLIGSSDGGYTYSRIEKLQSLRFDNISSIYYFIISVDNSLLVRIGYPVVALNMFIDHPFGLGIGGFSQHLKDYTGLLHTSAFYQSEVIHHLKNLNADARNYFLTIAVDTGILGLTLFILFLLYLIIRIKKTHNDDIIVKLMFSLLLGMMMQFSTIYFSPYLFMYAMILSDSE
ncbi:O-antigen ligase family protein [Aliivibrio fischeri]|uniref:O-antigen ligase family protein n=1 Tax=Aliivibrio fischeri TaxID=668 RepID=UPI00080EE32E|nr:O-antigen ligase family protein [Aliivibrio fischeri]OCH10630.1 hypothetical protein A6E09_11400 [Aliivibrio fischeri]